MGAREEEGDGEGDGRDRDGDGGDREGDGGELQRACLPGCERCCRDIRPSGSRLRILMLLLPLSMSALPKAWRAFQEVTRNLCEKYLAEGAGFLAEVGIDKLKELFGGKGTFLQERLLQTPPIAVLFGRGMPQTQWKLQ